MEFAALRKKKEDSSDNYRIQVAVKPEQHESVGQPWNNNKSDRQATYHHKPGWRQTNSNNELDMRESAKIPNKRVYESQVNAITGTSGTQRPSHILDMPATNSKN